MCKRLLILAFCCLASAKAQTVPVVQAGKPFKLGYDHELNRAPVAVYLNGTKLKDFTISEITLITTNGTTSFSFSINIPGVDRGFHRITMTEIHSSGESDHSLPLDFRAKPSAPFNLRIIQP